MLQPIEGEIVGLLGKNSGITGFPPNFDTFKLKQCIHLSLPPYFIAFWMKKTENFGEEKSPPSIMVWGKIVGQHEEYTAVFMYEIFKKGRLYGS